MYGHCSLQSTNERGPSLVGSLGLSCRFNRFVFSLASVRPVQNIFFLTSIFPHRPTIWAGSQAGSPVFWYVSLNLMLRKYFSKGRWVQHAWASFTVSILSDAESLGLKKTMEKRETPHISFRVFLTHAISSVFFHYCQEIDFCWVQDGGCKATVEQWPNIWLAIKPFLQDTAFKVHCNQVTILTVLLIRKYQ